MTVWLNGTLCESDEAHIDVRDRGFLLGDGVFETFCAVDGLLVDGNLHFARLRQGAAFLGIPLTTRIAELREACMNVLRANDLKAARARVRLTVTRGPGPPGLLPPKNATATILITATAEAEPPSEISLTTSSVRRNEHSQLTRFKTLNYLDNILARRDARASGEVVMINTAGNIACASAANAFVVENGRLITPPVRDGALPGIARRRLMTLAPLCGLRPVEETIEPARLTSADEIVLTNSLIGVCPVTSVDGRARDIGTAGKTLPRLYWNSVCESHR